MKNRTTCIGIILAILLSLSCAPGKVRVAPTVPPVTKPAPPTVQQPPVVTPQPPVVAPPTVWTIESALTPAPAIPDLRDDESAQSLLDAVDRSTEKFLAMKPDTIFRFGADAVPLSRIVGSLRDFRVKLAELGLSEKFFCYLRDNYAFYSSAAPQVTFTGYYEPLVRGSRRQSPRYPYPLYARPADLVTVDSPRFYFHRNWSGLPQIRGRVDGNNNLVPYYTRKEIDFDKKLAGRGLEIVWIDDLVDVFFLHVQGSGIVELDDGSRVFVGYADQNGHPFRSLGRYLLERQLIDRGQLSLQGMKRFLRDHPEVVPEALSANPSYIFFEINGLGAMGTFGTLLTPWRSIASDQRLFPLGALAWIECEKPVFDKAKRIVGWEKFGRFVLNQDTGGAIRGADHVDLFTGQGELSELVAGNMKQKGALYFLLQKEPSARQ